LAGRESGGRHGGEGETEDVFIHGVIPSGSGVYGREPIEFVQSGEKIGQSLDIAGFGLEKFIMSLAQLHAGGDAFPVFFEGRPIDLFGQTHIVFHHLIVLPGGKQAGFGLFDFELNTPGGLKGGLMGLIGGQAGLFDAGALGPAAEDRDADVQTQDLEREPFFAGAEEIELADYDIEDLEGIEFCRNLVKLDLSDNRLIDISALAVLSTLEELYISNNLVESIDRIYTLKQLRILDISGNDISDISVLQRLNKLEYINITGNQVPRNQVDALKEQGVIVIY